MHAKQGQMPKNEWDLYTHKIIFHDRCRCACDRRVAMRHGQMPKNELDLYKTIFGAGH
jgi:hypothetical protein